MANFYIRSIVDRREELMCATSRKQQKHLEAAPDPFRTQKF